MRSAAIVLGQLEDRRHLPANPTLQAPKSFSRKPVVFAPHPPLLSGGWYNGAGQESIGPGRYPVPRPTDKTAASALLWTTLFGPLGLCYLSPGAGLATAALTVGLVALSGSAVALAVVWPVVMLLSFLYASDRH